MNENETLETTEVVQEEGESLGRLLRSLLVILANSLPRPWKAALFLLSRLITRL